jgi:MraZ protein
MIMFLSSFYGIIDSKNRVAIPSAFRSTISSSKEKIYIYKSLKYECLEVHLSSKINVLIKSFDEKDFFSKKNDHFKTAILSDLEEINIDKEGRFILKEQLQKFSKLSKELIFIGKGNHFEIWEKKLGESHKKISRAKFK